MTERDERRRHWFWNNAMLVSLIGMLITYGVGGVYWVGTTSERLDGLDRATLDATTRIERLEGAAASTRESLARLEETLAAQARAIDRMEATLSDIALYLRGAPR